jgi:hypothetical protein
MDKVIEWDEVVLLTINNNYYSFRDMIAELTTFYEIHSLICEDISYCVSKMKTTRADLVKQGKKIVYEFYKRWDKLDGIKQYEMIIFCEKY